MVFGKTVPDISLNAIANLGYASGRFDQPVYPGDTLSTTSTVIGLKQNSNHKTGIVYVRSIGINQRSETVVDYIRWVMVPKRNPELPAPEPVVPDLPDAITCDELAVPFRLDTASYDTHRSGSPHVWEDYEVGERIDHVDGMTIEEAEHMLATRLYQNTARVHFNQHVEREGRFGRRIVYGGHIISLARDLVQRTGQRTGRGRDKWWSPYQSNIRRRYDLCLVGDPRQAVVARPRGPWRTTHPHRCHQRPAVQQLALSRRGRQVRAFGRPGFRLHRFDAETFDSQVVCVAEASGESSASDAMPLNSISSHR